MKSTFPVFTAVLMMILTSQAFANSAPVVSNVLVSQRSDDSKLVDIHYNLADADGDGCTVWVLASDNGGSTWNVPAFTLIGDCGSNISSGNNKHIVWDAGGDVPGKVGNLKIRVFADDGRGAMSLVFVPAGSFHYQRSTWIQLPSYFMGKYEVTCRQYCTFLNNADPDGNYYYTGHPEIYQYGEAGNYSYSVIQGKEQYPVRYVNFYDSEAYCQWLSTTEGRNYRLPTEQEWEKAAGWDPALQKLWTYGFQQDTISCNWCNYSNCVGDPREVGYYNGVNPSTNDAKSYYGCYDMSGNLFEQTSSISSGLDHVLRGGAWTNVAGDCPVALRFWSSSPPYRSGNIGFRLVLDLD